VADLPFYAGLFAAVAASWIGVPVVGGGFLAAAGVLASEGDLPLLPVFAVACVAAWLGGAIGYLIGWRYGRQVVELPGPWQDGRRRLLGTATRVYGRWGRLGVFVMPSWASGALRMPRRSYWIWNTWSVLVSNAIALAGAYGLGKVVLGVASRNRLWIALAGALIAALAGAVVLYRRRAARGEALPESS
jgi:membrane protein DedA with SNARE-associated domain